jgi:cobalt/nickel transport system permease protein
MARRQVRLALMHVPDGFLDAPTSLATGAVAVLGVGMCLSRARAELDERTVPLAGLVAAFVFAAQMFTFPVAAGTSGHLLGGALATVLVGPWVGALCVSVVLVVQAVLFADGGLTALGTNICLMALVTCAVTQLVVSAGTRVVPRSRSWVLAVSFSAALVSVPVAALGFVLLFGIGGTTDVPLGTLAVAVGGVHLLIGVGEAAITAFTVSSVLTVRPDLVRAARTLLPPATLAGPGLRAPEATS